MADELWNIDADESQISQVFQNLIINADHAMPNGGIIKVLGCNIVLDKGSALRLEPGKYVRITVSDQGVGISEKHFDKIFDPYFTTKQHGSGLGLAIVYSIVRNHSGHITVESEIGEGTTFQIYLPAVGEPESDTGKNTDIPISGYGRILIMDDEKLVRDTASRILAQCGYDVIAVEDGRQALDAYKKEKALGNPFDLVILDLTIPGGRGGMEVMADLLEINPQVKAIVSSGYSSDPIMASYKEHGFSGVLSKPYQIVEASRQVHNALNCGKLTG